MITISLCMIVKDEEEVLARCLNSIKDMVDEIIIVDTGSTDKTLDIAKSFTDKVYTYTWIDDFSAARNYSFSKATMEYCMWLDADDVIEAQEHLAFMKLKEELDLQTNIVMMKYHVAFDKDLIPTFTYYRERLIKNHMGFIWQSPIHESITPMGNLLYSEIAVSHKKLHPGDPDRNIRIFEKMIGQGKKLDARQKYYYGRELYYHERFSEAITTLEDFLNDNDAWIENKIEACQILYSCHSADKDNSKALQCLFRSFEFDNPRSEICCDIGAYFMKRQLLNSAIFWYELALTRKPENKLVGFSQPECYDYIPNLQLCVCHDKLGNRQLANAYNEKAGLIKPLSDAYLYNKKYFESHK